MARIERHIDDDPPPRGFRPLGQDFDSMPFANPTEHVVARKLSEAQTARLRRDLAIYLVIEGGMSQRVAAKVFRLSQVGILKAYRRMSARKSRV